MQRVRNNALGLIALAVAAVALVVSVADVGRGGGDGKDAPRSNAHDYALWLVGEAIDRYERDGRDTTLAHYNSRASVDGPWYVFVIDGDGALVGHYNPDVRGRSLAGPLGTDITGYDYGRAMMATDENGRWVSYVFLNPETGEEQRKHSWVIRHDGLLFGTGWYDYASLAAPPPSKLNAEQYAIWLVEQALHRLERDGLEATLAYYNTEESLDGPWYVFMIDDRDGALYSVANANRTDLVGTTYDRIDANGFDYGAAFARTVDGGAGQWVSYLFTHPITREDDEKHTWIVRRGNILIGAGWYEGIQ